MEDLWLYYNGEKLLDKGFHKIYGIKSDKCGYPEFLVRKDNQWLWRSAKHFIPEEEARYKHPERFEIEW